MHIPGGQLDGNQAAVQKLDGGRGANGKIFQNQRVPLAAMIVAAALLRWGPSLAFLRCGQSLLGYSSGNLHLKDSPILLRFQICGKLGSSVKCQYLLYYSCNWWISKTSQNTRESFEVSVPILLPVSMPHFPSFVGCRIEFMDRALTKSGQLTVIAGDGILGAVFVIRKWQFLNPSLLGGLNSHRPQFPFPTWKRLWLKSKRKNI